MKKLKYILAALLIVPVMIMCVACGETTSETTYKLSNVNVGEIVSVDLTSATSIKEFIEGMSGETPTDEQVGMLQDVVSNFKITLTENKLNIKANLGKIAELALLSYVDVGEAETMMTSIIDQIESIPAVDMTLTFEYSVSNNVVTLKNINGENFVVEGLTISNADNKITVSYAVPELGTISVVFTKA